MIRNFHICSRCTPALQGSAVPTVWQCWSLLLVLVFLVSSCSNTKFLEQDEKLYTYTWLSTKGLSRIKNKPLKVYELYLVGDVKTNRPIFLLPRTNLTIYNYCKPSGDWGFRYYIHRVFGKPPVLLKQVNPEFRVKVMKQRLSDMGHFDSDIQLDLKVYGKNDRKVRAKYKVFFKPAYRYRKLEFIQKHTPVDLLIEEALSASIPKSGNGYWLKELKEERTRLANVLKDKGYYFFQPDHLMFYADTTAGQRQVDLQLVTKDEVPGNAFRKYSVSEVEVVVYSDKPDGSEARPNDSTIIEGIHYRSVGSPFRPKTITRGISIVPGDLYTRTAHQNSLRYLQGLGSFRSVEIQFRVIDSLNHRLKSTVKLLPVKPLQTRLEMNFATKSNDFLGPAAILSIGHMNIFRGSERLVFQLDGGFEWQTRSRRRAYELGFNSYEFGTQLKLTVPRFLLPFRVKSQSQRYVPKTFASVGLRTLRRVKYYTMNLSQLRYGYTWRTSPKREYKVEPVNIDYLNLAESSAEFEEYLAQYPLVARSFEEQFIIGASGSYTYSSSPQTKRLHRFFYNGMLDLSGNLVNSIYELGGLKEAGESGKLFGVPYAQFMRLTNDLRYYWSFHEKRMLAMRLYTGTGVPYGNSTVLPYVKQYFAGGSQDIRAFYARSLGPGSYAPPDSLSGNITIDQSGEIKLLANVEYRFPITYKTYGAFFLDAGNVWLLKEDESRPGGKFEFSNVLDEIALGAGTGIRVDITYFVLRLDAAVPVRKPYLEGPEKWIFNNSSFWGDFILSFAVGYPF